MKENTFYNDYRFAGKIDVDEIQPWFDFASNKPWDESEIPWVVENKVRREILIKLSEGPKSFEEIYNTINFSPKPLLIEKKEYKCQVSYQWTRKTIENHLLNLEWNNLIKANGDKYEITFPIFKIKDMQKMELFITKFATHWSKIVKQTYGDITDEFSDIKDKPTLNALLIEKTVEKLYEFLKIEGLMPNQPNIKTLWAEQLRDKKFEEWVMRNF